MEVIVSAGGATLEGALRAAGCSTLLKGRQKDRMALGRHGSWSQNGYGINELGIDAYELVHR